MTNFISPCPGESNRVQAANSTPPAAANGQDQAAVQSDAGFSKIMRHAMDDNSVDNAQQKTEAVRRQERPDAGTERILRPLLRPVGKGKAKPAQKEKNGPEQKNASLPTTVVADAGLPPTAAGVIIPDAKNPAEDAATAMDDAVSGAPAVALPVAESNGSTSSPAKEGGLTDPVSENGESEKVSLQEKISPQVAADDPKLLKQPTSATKPEVKDGDDVKKGDAAKETPDIKRVLHSSPHDDREVTKPVNTTPVLHRSEIAANAADDQSVRMSSPAFSGVLQQERQTAPDQVLVDAPVAKNAGNAESSGLNRTGSGDTGAFDKTMSITRDGNRLAVRLEPEGLGKLHINLSLHDGVVKGQFQVANDGARTLLENNMRGMMDALAQDGLQVGGFSVALHQDSSGNLMTGNGWAEQTGNAAEGAQPEQAAAVSASSTRLVNLFV